MNVAAVTRAKLGFPVAWGDDLEELAFSEGDCPASIDQMKEYLKINHYHYVLDEETLDLGEFKQVAKWVFSNRRFWLWSCPDGVGREWMILVGSGTSPFAGETKDRKCWFFGQTNAAKMTPDEILTGEFPEYAGMSGKVN